MKKGLKILVVEDNRINAEMERELLIAGGADVVWAMNGQEAVNAFAQSSVAEIDLILMDIQMPVMDGLEAARRIREMTRQDAASVPILAMTTNTHPDNRRAVSEAGMNAFLAKPLDPLLMYEEINRVLEKGIAD